MEGRKEGRMKEKKIDVLKDKKTNKQTDRRTEVLRKNKWLSLTNCRLGRKPKRICFIFVYTQRNV